MFSISKRSSFYGTVGISKDVVVAWHLVVYGELQHVVNVLHVTAMTTSTTLTKISRENTTCHIPKVT